MYSTKNDTDIRAVEKVICVLKRAKDVENVPAGQIATKLQSIGLQPNFGVQTKCRLVQTWAGGCTERHYLHFLILQHETYQVALLISQASMSLEPSDRGAKPVSVPRSQRRDKQVSGHPSYLDR